MKRCSYCGAEYPDDATACAIDQTPFEDVQIEPAAPFKFPKFAIISEHEIPASLTVVSYFFFIPGAFFLAACPAIAFFGVFVGLASNSGIVLPCIAAGVVAILILLCLCIYPVTMILAYILITVFAVLFAGGRVSGTEAILH
jgi:hypothetical protein